MTKIVAYNQGFRSLLAPKRKFLRRKIWPKARPTIKASVNTQTEVFTFENYGHTLGLQSRLPLTPKPKFYVVWYDQKRGLQSKFPLVHKRKFLHNKIWPKTWPTIRATVSTPSKGFACEKYDQNLSLQSRLPVTVDAQSGSFYVVRYDQKPDLQLRLPLTPKRTFLHLKIWPKAWPPVEASGHRRRPTEIFT